MKKTIVPFNKILNLAPPIGIVRAKKKFYRNKYRFYRKSLTLNGGSIMNLNNSNILSYCGFAAAGVAAYSYFANGNTNFAFAAGGAALLCAYGAFAAAKSELADKEHSDEIDGIWRENSRLWEQISEIEERLASRATKAELDDASRDLRSDFDAAYRYIDDCNESTNRHINTEVEELHRKVDAVEISSACESACTYGKRGK